MVAWESISTRNDAAAGGVRHEVLKGERRTASSLFRARAQASLSRILMLPKAGKTRRSDSTKRTGMAALNQLNPRLAPPPLRIVAPLAPLRRATIAVAHSCSLV